ncbi:UFM1 specific peptidase 1 isoform X2 [Dermacentor variabilis]
MATILEDVHEGLGLPLQASRAACVKGKYAYYHYGCDGVDDRGWGCGYRTLQTICSWVVYHKHKTGERARAVPSITEIQAALVRLGDKEAQFSGSRDWIGSTEVFLCLDHFYQVPCRILHASTGGKVANHVDALLKHFEQQGSPVMMDRRPILDVIALRILGLHIQNNSRSNFTIRKLKWVMEVLSTLIHILSGKHYGGDSDASSKGILGVCRTSSEKSHLLVLDPHWYRDDAKHGNLTGAVDHLQQNGWISWRPLDSLMESSFYNLCLPLLPSPAVRRS